MSEHIPKHYGSHDLYREHKSRSILERRSMWCESLSLTSLWSDLGHSHTTAAQRARRVPIERISLPTLSVCFNTARSRYSDHDIASHASIRCRKVLLATFYLSRKIVDRVHDEALLRMARLKWTEPAIEAIQPDARAIQPRVVMISGTTTSSDASHPSLRFFLKNI